MTPEVAGGAPGSAADVSGLRLAIVNWRDPRHPAAGGAERYAWELARRLAARGAAVSYVTCRAPGQVARDRAEEVEFVRVGGRFTVYPRVLLWMLARRRRFDAVIDCQNGIPFFTPWVLPRRVPVLCVIHHVHDEQFGLYFPGWLAWIGRVLEGPVTRWTYRRHACVAVSLTTRQAVRARLRWRGPIYIVPNGLSAPPAPAPSGPHRTAPSTPAGRSGPVLVCVTRLVPHKRVERVLDLADRLRDRFPGLRVDIVGDGPEAARLTEAVAARELAGTVVMHGYVTEERKAELVRRADLHLSTTKGEGWGLSVIEAAALGVPTVAYDVEGLRDAVRDGVTGWLVPQTGEHGRSDDLPDAVGRALKELADPVRRQEIRRSCVAWAGRFDWARTADRMAALVAASVRAGSSATTDDDAHVVRGYGDEHPRVVEGPVRDELLRRGRLPDAPPDAPPAEIRPATPQERLLGMAIEDRSDAHPGGTESDRRTQPYHTAW